MGCPSSSAGKQAIEVVVTGSSWVHWFSDMIRLWYTEGYWKSDNNGFRFRISGLTRVTD